MVVQGDTIIRGGRNVIDLADTELKVDSNATLTIHNVWLKGLKGTNLQATTTQSKITLSESTLMLSHNFSFTQGSLRFEGDTILTGTNSFDYSSDQPMSVGPLGTLALDRELTFNYNPTSGNRDLFVLDDVTSRLFMNGCNINTNSGGLRLTTGTLMVGQINNFYSDASSPDQGISFGDGNPDHDLNIVILPGGSINVRSGILTYNNVN